MLVVFTDFVVFTVFVFLFCFPTTFAQLRRCWGHFLLLRVARSTLLLRRLLLPRERRRRRRSRRVVLVVVSPRQVHLRIAYKDRSTLIVLTVNEKSFTCKRCDLSKTACDPFERRTKKVHDEKIYFLQINK